MYRSILVLLSTSTVIGLLFCVPEWWLRDVLAAQPLVGPDFIPPAYRGRVVQITEKTVTLKLEGYLQFNKISWLPDGTKQQRKYVQDNGQPPKEFVFGDQLFPTPNGDFYIQRGHKIGDLRAGDVIEIHTNRWRGIDYCCEIEIHRRPGGKVPPAAGDEEWSRRGKRLDMDLDKNRWDVRMNAEQAREEKAVAALLKVGLRFIR